LASNLSEIFETKKAESLEVTTEMLEMTSLPQRLRNGIARLFIPVL